MTVAERIKAEEGWSAHVYPDSLGYATIGYGFLIDGRRGEGLPLVVAEFWLDYLLTKIRDELATRWPPFSAQPIDVRGALMEMAYQMGVDGVLGFQRMLAALERGDRAMAAADALDSVWHAQTPARCERVAALIRGT